VIEVLQRAKEKGKTRFIGYSGDGSAARYAVECGAFDTLQTSLNIADQEAIGLTIPEAAKRGMGVIAKRPIANAVWKHRTKPAEAYHQPYRERLRKLDYPFLHGDWEESVGMALRFTLSVPGVHTAIVGTAKPDRFAQNARLLGQGNLSPEQYEAIRSVWNRVAEKDWVGLT
jgi:aryl-alcohol dehydrogenase-like predicted oxidoreductase